MPPMGQDSVRRALYVLFARLVAGAPDAALYARLRTGGLDHLAAAQRVDLTSDLLDAADAEASATELGAEYDRLAHLVSLRASDYAGATEDPVASVAAFLTEHGLSVDARANLPCDHMAVVLGIMGELAGQADEGTDPDGRVRARSFFLRHIQPWMQRALTDMAAAADRNFYRGVAAMLDAFLQSEHRTYRQPA
jgi:TorA maturation chaperone TorD